MANNRNIRVAVETKKTRPYGDADWVKGAAGGYLFQALLFDEGSEYGIDEGRVSKLCVWPEEKNPGSAIINYDRGWDVKPQNDDERAILDAVLAELEDYPIGGPED